MRLYIKRIFIFILLILLSIYLIGQRDVEVAKVKVEITKAGPYEKAYFNESDREDLIGNISIERVSVNKIKEPKGNDMHLPGISVGLFKNKIMISEWTSVPLNNEGTYELLVGFNQPVEDGATIRIAVYVNDNKGNVIIGKRKDLLWE